MSDDFKLVPQYINRELSWIAFNRRVLERARDPEIPLLERLRFLCISSTNLDEFFEIRVGGLKQQVALGSVDAGPDNLVPAEVLQHIHTATQALVAEQYEVLNRELLPELASERIRFVRREHWSLRQSEWIRRYFHREVLPVLSPQSLDPAHPFPRLLNKSLNFIVALEGRDAFGRDGGFAVVPAPRALPRVIPLGPCQETVWDFVFLSSVIHAYVGELFPGMTVRACHQFRVTRNSDLFVDEEEIEDLLRALEGELPSRNYGSVVRLEVSDRCPADIAQFLLQQLGLGIDDLYAVEGPVNLNRLQSIHDLVERPDLTFPAFTPALPRRLTKTADLFETIRRGEVLLHHPFESFAPVVAFVHQAALDPHVLAIKQTLYRVGPDSALVDALVVAARSGKEVTVVIELRARFDEEANIRLATRLHEAGAHVVYGVVGYKTHAKMVLVVRREGRRLRRYVHLATGNYHARTTRTYTDYGLFTAERQCGEDVHRLFLQLTGLSRVAPLKKLVQAPFTLHKTLVALIAREIEHTRSGGSGRIIAKMNALSDPQIIQALYQASQAGVTIDLIVRGICCLRPGVAGLSDNIRVRSIIGRFLEHSRVFYFANQGNEQVYVSSADWMYRNFFARIEIAFPVEDARLRTRIIRESLTNYLADNTDAWLLHSDGQYTRLKPGHYKKHSAQMYLLEHLADTPPALTDVLPTPRKPNHTQRAKRKRKPASSR